MNGIIVRVDGLDELLAKVGRRKLLADPLRQALKQLAQSGEQQARQVAPYRTGRLQAALTHRIDARPIPKWGLIRTTALSSRGFPYPRLLEYAPKWHHLGWMRGAIKQVMRNASSVMDRAASQIERIWSS